MDIYLNKHYESYLIVLTQKIFFENKETTLVVINLSRQSWEKSTTLVVKKKSRFGAKKRRPVEGIPELMACQICASFWQLSAAGTANFLLTKSQELPQKLASHWADSQINIESFCTQKNGPQIDVSYSCFRGWPAGRMI